MWNSCPGKTDRYSFYNMGTIYSVSCRDCKITRDLDKFYTLSEGFIITNRTKALAFAKEVAEDSFRAGLLMSFLEQHKGHNCTVFNEHDEKLTEELDPFYGNTTEDTDFWRD